MDYTHTTCTKNCTTTLTPTTLVMASIKILGHTAHTCFNNNLQNFKVPGKPMEYYHNESSQQYKDEGQIQYFVIPTQKLLDFEHVFVSVWAVNKASI